MPQILLSASSINYMAQLKHYLFVKTSLLTERAYAVANTIWPDVEGYIESFGSVSRWVEQVTRLKSDPKLQNLLKQHFSALLSSHGFLLHDLSLTLFSDASGSIFGSQEAFIAIKTSGTTSLPLVILDISINTAVETAILRSLFHEITHLEQSCNVLMSYTADTLVQILPKNKAVNVANLSSYGETETSPISGTDELAAYANDFALKLVNIYKQQLKALPVDTRLQFVKSVIIPHYSDHMLPELKEQLAKLTDSKRNYFLKNLVRQLTEFSAGLI